MRFNESTHHSPAVKNEIEHAACSGHKSADIASAPPHAVDANGVRGREAKAACKLNAT
jgi:hypothetical protein